MSRQGISYLTIATLTYAILQVVDKYALQAGVEVAGYTLGRVIIAMVFIAMTLLPQGRRGYRRLFERTHIKDLIIIGVLASGIGLLFQIIGLSHSTATNVSVLLALVAPCTSAIAAVVVKEKLTVLFWTATALMVVGVWLIYLKNQLSPFGWGDCLVLLAVVGFAYSNVHAGKTMRDVPTRIVTLGRLFFGSVSIAVLLPVLPFSFQSLSAAPVVVLLGGLIFGVRMYTYYKGIELEGASVAATYLLFSPAVTALSAYVVLNEPLTPSILLGIGLTILGGCVLVRGRS